MRFPLLLLPIIILASCQPRQFPPADLILINGEVYTMEEDQPWASAVVITGNTITAVIDNNESADAYRDENTRVIDLKGKFVVPGFKTSKQL